MKKASGVYLISEFCYLQSADPFLDIIKICSLHLQCFIKVYRQYIYIYLYIRIYSKCIVEKCLNNEICVYQCVRMMYCVNSCSLFLCRVLEDGIFSVRRELNMEAAMSLTAQAMVILTEVFRRAGKFAWDAWWCEGRLNFKFKTRFRYLGI